MRFPHTVWGRSSLAWCKIEEVIPVTFLCSRGLQGPHFGAVSLINHLLIFYHTNYTNAVIVVIKIANKSYRSSKATPSTSRFLVQAFTFLWWVSAIGRFTSGRERIRTVWLWQGWRVTPTTTTTTLSTGIRESNSIWKANSRFNFFSITFSVHCCRY